VTTRRTYTSMQVVSMTGCTYRQLDWWCRQGHIPGQEGVTGSGNRRAFTTAQVKRVRLLLKASVIRNTRLDEQIEMFG
jgi:DNA-binding transcriptional MerR regulator